MAKSKEGKYYEDRPCCLCIRMGIANDTPAIFHHTRDGRLGKRGVEGIPLCWEHHVGKLGIHTLGKKAWEKRFKLTEAELLAMCQSE